MMRRPDRLAGLSISLGRREIEPESFVSRSCVGDRFPKGLDTCSIGARKTAPKAAGPATCRNHPFG